MADELITLETLAGTLPDPHEFRQRALKAARDGYAAAIEGREVHTPEDTFEVQRQLARTRELAKQYASAFTAVDKELATFQRDQLEALPGNVLTSLKVPDADGDLTVQLDQANSYSFDLAGIIGAVAAHVAETETPNLIDYVESASDAEEQCQAVSFALFSILEGFADAVMQLGKFEAQVTKVRAYADMLARAGQAGLSGVVRDAIIKTTTTKPGAKFARKEGPK